MDTEQLKMGNRLEQRISDLEGSHKVIKQACSQGFGARNATINILGTQQSEGDAIIPASVFKAVCQMILLATESELLKAKQEFENL